MPTLSPIHQAPPGHDMNATRDILEQCRTMIRLGSKSFAAAARLFDGPTRDAVTLLYGWCRYCDDQVDGQSFGHSEEPIDAPAAQVRLQTLTDATRAAYHGSACEHLVFRAFQFVVHRYRIQERFPLELLKGLEMDVCGERYRTFEDLLLYCYRVAGTVGLMMSQVIGAYDDQAHKHAVDLGIAMQLTNIARDVVEDDGVGRMYLPLAWLEEAGISSAELTAPRHRAALAGLVRRLLDEAQKYYASGDQGLRYLPFRSACAVAAAREVYAAIGVTVLARGVHAWDVRAVVPRWKKLWLIARGLVRVLTQRFTPRGEALLLPSRVFLQPDKPLE
jgi:15-cis-phytoene synthase